MATTLVILLAMIWICYTLLSSPPNIRRAIIAVREAGRLTIVEGE